VPCSGSLKVPKSSSRYRDGLSGTARQRAVPLPDTVGNEGPVAEGPAVSAGTVPVSFPDAVNQLGQGSEPFLA
jgi:hypothetical protein